MFMDCFWLMFVFDFIFIVLICALLLKIFKEELKTEREKTSCTECVVDKAKEPKEKFIYLTGSVLTTRHIIINPTYISSIISYEDFDNTEVVMIDGEKFVVQEKKEDIMNMIKNL